MKGKNEDLKRYEGFECYYGLTDTKRNGIEALFNDENKGIPLEEFEKKAERVLGSPEQHWPTSAETIKNNGFGVYEMHQGAYYIRIVDGKVFSVHR